MPTLTPQAFVAKWRAATLTERSSYQQHFLDLCALIGHPTPAEDDPTGERFTFEAGVAKLSGGQGFADVWKRGYFAWEYKGKHANLDKAYQQLQQYREALLNPPLLVVSDINTIQVHTNFTNTVKRVRTLTLEDLLTPQGQRELRAIFYEPDYFRAAQTTQQVTEAAAAKFAQLAQHLQAGGAAPDAVAHFLIRLLFCLFAEDIDLLPNRLFSKLTEAGRRNPGGFNRQLRQLFEAMAVGDFFGVDAVPHFNGGLFDQAETLELDAGAVRLLHEVASLDWSSIEPSIFGTLFERSLDPTKRSQLGAHYTSRDDILLIVEPVLMAPLRREWAEVQEKAHKLVAYRDSLVAGGDAYRRTDTELRGTLVDFVQLIASTRVLDPACGSGNFLYVALRELLNLEKEVSQFAGTLGLPGLLPQSSPTQLYGIELNEYAHELAQTTVWIGYIQWLHDNGYGVPPEPILKQLDNIKQMDAILAFDAEGNPIEPAWPEADVIIGNPPFLGGGRLRSELGDKYTDTLFSLYGDRLPNFSDLVCYWFERTRAKTEAGSLKRAGLLATNSIRGGANRRVLERIKESGDIFMAWSDRPWTLDGAAVRVSMVGFDDGSENGRVLDGKVVPVIHADLTSETNLIAAQVLQENQGICFMGPSAKAPFDIEPEIAERLLSAPLNVNGRSNSDVVKPVYSAIDIARRPRGMWTIDYGLMSYEDAAQYEAPFQYVIERVLPVRQTRRDDYRGMWWQYARPRPELRNALVGLERFIATPGVAKHRLFLFVDAHILCNQGTLVITRDDDYFFGVLHSRFHELWSLRLGTSLEDRPRYTPTTTFETFPFPWPPGQEPVDDPCVQAIATAAKELHEKREAWLNPPGLSEAELKKRTLTNLYNARPTWLDLAHQKLDTAVAAAYGWPADLPDEEILARLLALNLARAGSGD